VLSAVPLWTLVFAVGLGVLIGFQPGSNATIGRSLGHPIYGALTNNIVGMSAMLVLFAVLLGMRNGAPPLSVAVSNAGGAPWWAWFGGLCGASYVIASILLAPRMGIALLFTCMLLGQLLVSLAIDNFGLVGQPKRPINPGRFLGIALVIAGLVVNYLSTGKQ